MAKDRDIRQSIAASRALLQRCDQGRLEWLSQLARPLPPLLDNNWQRTAQALAELTGFDPLEGLDETLESAQARPVQPVAKKRNAPGISPGNVQLPLSAGQLPAGPGRASVDDPSRARRAALMDGAASVMGNTAGRSPGLSESLRETVQGARSSSGMSDNAAVPALPTGTRAPAANASDHPIGGRKQRREANEPPLPERLEKTHRKGTDSLAARRRMRARQRFQSVEGESATPRQRTSGPAPTTAPSSAMPGTAGGAFSRLPLTAQSDAGAAEAALPVNKAALKSSQDVGDFGVPPSGIRPPRVRTSAAKPSAASSRANAAAVDLTDLQVEIVPADHDQAAPIVSPPTPSATARSSTDDGLALQLADAAYWAGVDST
jgi:hypothetical protein